jgi:ubiquinone biosynthesis protein
VYSRLTHRFFFNPPGWRREEVQVEGGYGMDMHRCPISDYLRSLGLGELCERAICDVDRRQAEMRGILLTRTETLAGGAERCDFRFSAGR